MWYVYILLCADGSFYTGCTNNVNRRVESHFNGKGARYTKSHKPKKLVYQEKLKTQSLALKREAKIKKLTKKQKETLVQKE